MNGFEAKSLDEDAFGEKPSLTGLKTFDAFREYIRHRNTAAPPYTFAHRGHFLKLNQLRG